MQCLHDIVYYIIVSSELNSISDESWLRVMITYGGSIDEVKQIMIKTGWVVVMRKLDIRGVLKSDCLLRNSLVINFMSLPRVVLCVTRRSGETSLTNTANCCIGSVRLVLGWYCCAETPNHHDPNNKSNALHNNITFGNITCYMSIKSNSVVTELTLGKSNVLLITVILFLVSNHR